MDGFTHRSQIARYPLPEDAVHRLKREGVLPLLALDVKVHLVKQLAHVVVPGPWGNSPPTLRLRRAIEKLTP